MTSFSQNGVHGGSIRGLHNFINTSKLRSIIVSQSELDLTVTKLNKSKIGKNDVSGWMDGRMDGRADQWMDGHTVKARSCELAYYKNLTLEKQNPSPFIVISLLILPHS